MLPTKLGECSKSCSKLGVHVTARDSEAYGLVASVKRVEAAAVVQVRVSIECTKPNIGIICNSHSIFTYFVGKFIRTNTFLDSNVNYFVMIKQFLKYVAIIHDKSLTIHTINYKCA